MTNPSDAAIESLLRQDFAGPVPDAGFSDAIMRHLPSRRRRATWPLWAGALAGIAACWLGLLHAPPLHAGWSDLMGGEVSAPAIVMLLAVAGLSSMAGWWAVTEAGR